MAIVVGWMIFYPFFFVCKSQLQPVKFIIFTSFFYKPSKFYLVSSNEIIQILAELSSVQHRKLMVIGDCTNQYVRDHIFEIVCGIGLTWFYHALPLLTNGYPIINHYYPIIGHYYYPLVI